MPRQPIRPTGELAGRRGDELVIGIHDRVLIQINTNYYKTHAGYRLATHARARDARDHPIGTDPDFSPLTYPNPPRYIYNTPRYTPTSGRLAGRLHPSGLHPPTSYGW